MIARTLTRQIRTLRGSAAPISFISNDNVYQFENELSKEENEEAVPPAPQFTDVKSIYSDIVSPSDVCDLVLCPGFEDVLITSLAKGSPISGNANYKILSRSSVSNSNLLFANSVTEWMGQFNSQILALSELASEESFMSYNNQIKSELLSARFSDDVLSNYKNVESFFQSFDGQGDKISVENIAGFLLSTPEATSDSTKYAHILKYLGNFAHLLNRFNLKDFVVMVLEDLQRAESPERVESFDWFFNECLMSMYPDILVELSPRMLDRLAYVISSSSNLTAASKILSFLVTHHQIAPRKATFDLFISRYSKTAHQHSKEQILRDLALLKPILFHHGLDANMFRLILSRVIDNTYDLSHFVKLAQSSTDLLAEFPTVILGKLQQIQLQTSDSRLTKAVQVTQLVKMLRENEIKTSDEFKQLLKETYLGLEIPFDVSKLD